MGDYYLYQDYRYSRNWFWLIILLVLTFSSLCKWTLHLPALLRLLPAYPNAKDFSYDRKRTYIDILE